MLAIIYYEQLSNKNINHILKKHQRMLLNQQRIPGKRNVLK